MARVRVIDVRHGGEAGFAAGRIAAELDAGEDDRHVVMIIDPAEIGADLGCDLGVNAEHVIAARVARASLLEVVIDVELRWNGGVVIRQREEVQQLLADWVNAGLGYLIASELLVVVSGIEQLEGDRVAVRVTAIRGEIADAVSR